MGFIRRGAEPGQQHLATHISYTVSYHDTHQLKRCTIVWLTFWDITSMAPT